jgi:hypothetical protein
MDKVQKPSINECSKQKFEAKTVGLISFVNYFTVLSAVRHTGTASNGGITDEMEIRKNAVPAFA